MNKEKVAKAKRELEDAIVKVDILIRSSKEDETILKEIHDSMVGVLPFISNGNVSEKVFTSKKEIHNYLTPKKKEKKVKDPNRVKIPMDKEANADLKRRAKWVASLNPKFEKENKNYFTKGNKWSIHYIKLLKENYKLTKEKEFTEDGENDLLKVSKLVKRTPIAVVGKYYNLTGSRYINEK